MLWIITEDNAEDGKNNGMVRTHSAARATAWRQAAPAEIENTRRAWIEECETEFRLLDSSDEVLYRGVCLRLDDQDGDSAFEPLDWAEGAGAARMEYRKKGEAVWRIL